MRFKRLILLFMCVMLALGLVCTFAEAAHKEFVVQNCQGVDVSVRVESGMFQKYIWLISDECGYTEEQWIGVFVRNLLVGRDADKITNVILSKSEPKRDWRKKLKCPPILPGKNIFWAYLSDCTLAIVCRNISSTLCDKWLLNETGLTLFGR